MRDGVTSPHRISRRLPSDGLVPIDSGLTIMAPPLKNLIDLAPWREAVTYRETWPHEYVMSEKDGQGELLKAICQRFRAGEGVACRFFGTKNTYLFIGEYKYWLMTQWDAIEPGVDYVINRARLYRDRRDFVILRGDTGKPGDYPVTPAYDNQNP